MNYEITSSFKICISNERLGHELRAKGAHWNHLVSALSSDSASSLLYSSSHHPQMVCLQGSAWIRLPPRLVQWTGQQLSYGAWLCPSKTLPEASSIRAPYEDWRNVGLQEKHLQIYWTDGWQVHQNWRGGTRKDREAQQTDYVYHVQIGIQWLSLS